MNLFLITYLVDIEQLVIADPYHFNYPLWPPRFAIDAVHWWGANFDPVLMARPVWWRVTIWIDALFFGPFYVFAIYAFVRDRRWIQLPALLWAATMLTVVTVILGEEAFGEHATSRLAIVLLDQRGLGDVPDSGPVPSTYDPIDQRALDVSQLPLIQHEGGLPTVASWTEAGMHPSEKTVRRLFGSFNGAVMHSQDLR